MKRYILRITVWACVLSGFANAKLWSQDVPPPVQVPYAEVTDIGLRLALTRLQSKNSHDYLSVEAIADAKMVLEQVANGSLPVSAHLEESIEDIITRCIVSGHENFIPVLKKIAKTPNLRLRHAIGEAYANSDRPSEEVLRELIAAAEAELPKDTSNKEDAQKRFNEFTRQITVYCNYVPLENREPAKLAVERFLNRYNDSSVRSFYEKRLMEKVSTEEKIPLSQIDPLRRGNGVRKRGQAT
ncbi:hypothetical protein [Prosthecobacter vanneervenii]|uniref:HEAT repeat domain-containing protein n=1 Tax=Prosthecobacter vanneervenii TaxID=48466 RepID=A0A7W7YEL3_9BACT|nr:hypothetical protein [Prosthecobacter vanneervenii]MBB5034674.1 hypothetical protein [Prosthecobacter vanneervenii]